MINKLLQIGKQLLAETDISHVLTLAIDGIIEITGAERGMIILFDENKILFETARNLDKKDINKPKFEISRTIINEVKTSRKPVCLRNALDDPVYRKSDSVDRLKILSVICLPLKLEDKIFGVVYLDNRSVLGVFD